MTDATTGRTDGRRLPYPTVEVDWTRRGGEGWRIAAPSGHESLRLPTRERALDIAMRLLQARLGGLDETVPSVVLAHLVWLARNLDRYASERTRRDMGGSACDGVVEEAEARLRAIEGFVEERAPSRSDDDPTG